jgi:dipeptidyl aminopeptidase/acylaminoacyl peptidase
LHQITFGGSDECPAWSPDDSKIVFDSGRLGPVTLYALFVMDSDGANQRSLVTDGHRNECADWSPDGTKLIFSRDTDSVAVMNADGSALSTVVSNVWAAPIWSPDGTKIAYNGYIANPDGSDATYTSSAVITGWQPLVSFAFTGFFAPIANLPAVNVARAGSAIPVIFGLGGDFGLNIFVAGSPYTRQVSCSTGEPMDDVEETVSAGNSSLSYDQATEKYTYVWKTSRSWRRPAASWSSGSRTGLST